MSAAQSRGNRTLFALISIYLVDGKFVAQAMDVDIEGRGDTVQEALVSLGYYLEVEHPLFNQGSLDEESDNELMDNDFPRLEAGIR